MHRNDSIHLRGKQTKKNTFEDYKFYLPQSNLFFFSAGSVRKPVPFHLILMIHLLLDSVKLSNTRSSVLCFWRAEVLVQVLSLPFFLPSTAMATSIWEITLGWSGRSLPGSRTKARAVACSWIAYFDLGTLSRTRLVCCLCLGRNKVYWMEEERSFYVREADKSLGVYLNSLLWLK